MALSFSIAVNLLTDNFKKGANQVKASFRAMQMQILTFAAALGVGGLGLSNFVSRLIEVARETNRVTTALKNVSGGALKYAQNQRFLLDIAKKYGLEINALTGNFAKFTASASASGMAMDQQKKTFESVSRACTAFGLSADDSNSVFLALSQMMSKGKISSEELRLQMGEKLPIALQAMAKAAGVSVGGLDKLMKQGKLMSVDMIPKFADALSEMIPNVDTDNLETSVNRLKNAFAEFTNGTGVQAKYKGMIDGLTEVVKYGAENIKSIINYTIAAILVLVTSKLINNIIGAIKNAELAAKTAARRSAKELGRSFDEIAWKSQKAGASIKMAFTKALGSLKSLFISSIPTFVIGVIASITARLINVREEAKRIKNIYSDYRKEIESSGNTAEITKLKSLRDLSLDMTKSSKGRNAAISELGKIMDIIKGKNESDLIYQGRINDAIKERIKLLENSARADAYAQQKINAEIKKNELLKQKSSVQSEIADLNKPTNKNAPWYTKTWDHFAKPFKKNGAFGIGALDTGLASKLNNINEEISALDAIISDAGEQLKTTIGNTIDKSGVIQYSDNDPNDKKTDLQKAEESYAKKIRELEARREVEKMSVSEYWKAYDELNKSALVEAMAMENGAIKSSEYYKTLIDRVKNPKYDKTQAELEKIQEDYSTSFTELKNQKEAGVLTEKNYNEKLQDLIKSTMDLSGSLLGAKAKTNEFFNALMAQKINVQLPELKKRDTTFDYKKSKSEIIEENLDVAKTNLQKIQKIYDEGAGNLLDELNNALNNVSSLEDALKIAQVKEDIKDLTKQLRTGVYDGMKNIMSGTDRIVSSFETLKNVMNDVNSSEWEKIMAIWNSLTSVVDGFLSIIELISNISAITKMVAEAKAVISPADTSVQISTIAAISGAKIAATTAETAIEKAASKEKTDAATTEMAAKSTAAYAHIPFWGLGLAAAQIAAMEALISSASIPKFANGGIVPGNSKSGDKILAGVNSGEMILNMGQQSKLFNVINSGVLNKGYNASISGRLVADGSQLVAVINSYNRKQKRIR